jgi:hypothetical protein
VVLADGRIVEATPTNEYRDLLWAVRGAAANFGVVTRIDMRLHPVDMVYGGLFGAVCEDPDDQAGVLHLLTQTMEACEKSGDLTRRVFGSSFIACLPPGHPAVRVFFFFLLLLRASDSH